MLHAKVEILRPPWHYTRMRYPWIPLITYYIQIDQRRLLKWEDLNRRFRTQRAPGILTINGQRYFIHSSQATFFYIK